MNRLAGGLVLLAAMGCKAACNDTRMVYDFEEIEPSTGLKWIPCFDTFTCSRLEVPLDYSNTSAGTTAIAFVKLAGKNATAQSPSIVFIHGGPGGSGIDLLTTTASVAGTVLGEQYNYVSFDPRGVNNSGPALDCFSGSEEARLAFNKLHRTGVTTASSIEQQYYTSSIYGEWCNAAVKNGSPDGYHVTTPAVAQDLLTFIEADAKAAGKPTEEAKLWAYGISYGTVTGTTFASMFPDRVGRMVLDGVMDADKYYSNNWEDTVESIDETLEMFSSLCHSAGPEACAFYGPSPENITARIDNIVQQLQSKPIPISGAEIGGLPVLVTYADLKSLFINTLYQPLVTFPALAEALSGIENGNISSLVGAYDSQGVFDDVRLRIQCADSYRNNKLSTLYEFKNFVEHTTSKSKYAGDAYPMFLGNILCRSMEPQLSDSMVAQGSITAETSFPILFASNTVDGLTPLKAARTMSSRFPRSVLLTQEGVGHVILNQGGSMCYFAQLQAYFQGLVPDANTTCPAELTPFLDDPPF